MLAVCAWLVAWQLLAWAVDVRIVLVGPLEVAARLGELVLTGEFWASLGLSLGRILAGLVAGLALGTLLAAVASRVGAVRELLAPAMGAIKAVPVASFVILVLLWVSSRWLSLVIAFLMALPIAYTNVLEGIRQTDPQLLEMARVFGLCAWDRVRLVYVAQVLPYFRAAFSLALGLSWKAGIAAEVIGLPDLTVGEHLYDAKVYLDTPSLFAWTVAIVVVSVCLEALVGRVLNRAVARWEARP
ncbi:ABC transporter permease subunit [Olsenella profusa]|uniref:ABC transporter permease subunit n=1 Tax=Olsenella profusa TaxID=138595 RepID=UPI00195C3850